MKRLIIQRHGKAENKTALDSDRDLELEGEEQIKKAGDSMRSKKNIPDLILFSPAIRALKTKDIIMESLEISSKSIIVKLEPVIYDNDYRQILKLISETDDGINTLMIIGHIPSLEEVLYFLIKENKPIGTGKQAVVDIEIESWRAIENSSGKARLIDFY